MIPYLLGFVGCGLYNVCSLLLIHSIARDFRLAIAMPQNGKGKENL